MNLNIVKIGSGAKLNHVAHCREKVVEMGLRQIHGFVILSFRLVRNLSLYAGRIPDKRE